MKQREVTDNENTRWNCVQAFSMANKENLDKATELSENDGDKVTVVCTPTGGAQTVRLELDAGWEELLSDGQLTDEIGQIKD